MLFLYKSLSVCGNLKYSIILGESTSTINAYILYLIGQNDKIVVSVAFK